MDTNFFLKRFKFYDTGRPSPFFPPKTKSFELASFASENRRLDSSDVPGLLFQIFTDSLAVPRRQVATCSLEQRSPHDLLPFPFLPFE